MHIFVELICDCWRSRVLQALPYWECGRPPSVAGPPASGLPLNAFITPPRHRYPRLLLPTPSVAPHACPSVSSRLSLCLPAVRLGADIIMALDDVVPATTT